MPWSDNSRLAKIVRVHQSGRAGPAERVQNVGGLPFRLRRTILIGENASNSARVRAKPMRCAISAQEHSTRSDSGSNERLCSDQINCSITPRGSSVAAARRGIGGSECRSARTSLHHSRWDSEDSVPRRFQVGRSNRAAPSRHRER